MAKRKLDLDQERAALERWIRRLRRAAMEVAKRHSRIRRLERKASQPAGEPEDPATRKAEALADALIQRLGKHQADTNEHRGEG